MTTEIDALSISIEAKAQKANSSIDKLVSRLDVLSNSLGKLQNGSNNLVALGRGVESLSRGMQGFKGVGEAKFIRLASGINQLANINTQGLNNAASSLSHMTRAFNNIGAVSQNAVQVADLAKNLGKLGNKSVTNAITNIPQLATAMNNLMTTLSKAPTVSENVIRMTNALANLSAQGAKVGSASNSIVKGLNRASNSATRARASFGGLASVIGKFYATYFLLIRAFKGLGKAIDSTADYLEAYNYFNVALGKIGSDWSHQFEQYGYESAEAYADSFSTRLQQRLSGLSGLSIQMNADGTGLLTETGLQNLGLNLQEVTQYASQLASVTNSIGQTGEVSLATASSITKLGSDLSSLFNLDYADVMQNLQSGLIGQSRALYKYGIDITNATLQTYAYELGLEKAVSEMTQAEKMQLRILAILDQSKVAWGDLANTINSPSNMMRQFSNNVKEVGMVLGQLFIPVLQKVMPIVNGLTIAIKRLLVSIASLLGINLDLSSFGQGFSGIEEDIDGIGDSFDDATASAKKFKTYTLGIDELNIQPEQAESGGSGAGGVGGGIDLTDEILEATSEYERVWQEAFDKMENRAQEFADRIEEFFAPITEPLKDLFKDISIGDWFSAGQDTSNLVSGIFDLFSNALEEVDWEGIGNNIGEYLDGIEWTKILKSAGNFVEKLINSAIDLWKGSFSADPIATTIVSALAVAKFTGLDKTLASKITMAMPKVLTVAVVAVVSFETGKSIGKFLFKDDAQWYDNFTWLGEGGFFDSIDNAGITNTLIAMNEMAMDLYSTLAELSNLGFLSPLFQMLEDNFASIARAVEEGGALAGVKEYFNQFVKNIETFGQSILDAGEKIETWFTEDVQPWFTAEKWEELFENAKIGLQTKWNEIVEWWQTTAIGKWFEEDVMPWFSKEKWTEMLKSIPSAFKQAFFGGVTSAISFINKLIDGIESMINSAIDGFAKLVDALNPFSEFMDLKGISFNVGHIDLPNIAIPQYINGGFPGEYSLFMAGEHGHAEMLGTVGGKTAVAGGAEITGIRDAVYQSSQTEAELLREQNELLRQLLAKDTSVNIGDREIAKANARGSRSMGYVLIT